MSALPPSLRGFSHAAKALALVSLGVSAVARRHFTGEGCVLTFHGVCADDEPTGCLDHSLHQPVSIFRAVCEHLAEHCRVLPLEELARASRNRETLPAGAVALTFDDGYASNYHLAYPILRRLKLPATIFLTTGFLDGEDGLWFQRVDRALRGGTREELKATLAAFKALPDAQMRQELQKLESSIGGTAALRPEDVPAVMRPLSWQQAREMRDSGLITFGGHTHTHPVLSRCTPEHQRREIEICRDRIQAELGEPPRTFAFPNGRKEDYTADTLDGLREAGFDLAWTMVNGRTTNASQVLELPRYGSPASAWEAEATVSGAFELSKEWRQRCLRALGGRLP